jgi:outer membrane protein assembly factor BamB
MGKYKWLLIIPISLLLIQAYCMSVASSAPISSGVGNWTMFRHDSSRSGYTTGSGAANSAELLWTFRTWKAIKSSPAVANGCVFVGSRDWRVYCIDSSSGEHLWNFTTGSEVDSSPAIYNNSVYVGSDDGYLYRIDIATGTPVWKSPLGGLVRSSPVIVDNRVYIGSGDHDVFCLNASDGAKIRSYPTSSRVQSAPAVVDGVVYVASDDYHVYAFNESTGDELWCCHTGSFFSAPCVCDGYVYAGSIDGYVCCLNASTGAKVWMYQTGGSVFSSPAVAYGCVYVGSDDNNVYCLNASDGEKIWQSPTGYWVRSSPAVADGNVYVGSEDFSVYCFNASTGAKKWSCETGSSVDSSPAIVNGTLYVGSSDYGVYAFSLDASTGESLPSQSTSALPWTTVAFDVIAFAVAAAVIFAVGRFARLSRSAKQNATVAKKLPWYSAHADALCIVVILAFSTIFFVNLGNSPLWVTDEQTYSQWAFHMFKTGDYLTPWTYGELDIGIAKPPLFMWLMSLAYQLFGVNNFASRFWSPVFGTLSLILVFYLGKKLYNLQVGFLSALVLGTFINFYSFARHAMTDVTFIFFILASVYFLLLSEKTESTNRYAALGGLFFGLAFMTKQVTAFLIPLIMFSYFIVSRRSIRFAFAKRFKRFWQVGVLVVSPWVIYMVLRFGPDFWQAFFIYSGFIRAGNPIEGHAESYLYYLNYLVNSENPVWVVLLPFATGFCAFNAVVKRVKEDTLILLWIAIVLAIFTFAQTKLEWYILPAFPAFAIAISSFLYQLSEKMHPSRNPSPQKEPDFSAAKDAPEKAKVQS